MSKTYKKYPTCYEYSNGVIYNSWNDLPERDWWVKDWKHVIKYNLERVYYDRYDKKGRLFDYFKMEMVPYRAYVELPTYRNIKRNIDSQTIYRYNEKSREGWSHSRVWHCGGVGKDAKRARQKTFRARDRQAIHQCMKGDEDYAMFAVNRQRDKWDNW